MIKKKKCKIKKRCPNFLSVGKGLEKKEIDAEIRVTVLGHIQEGSPIPFDRVLATQYGVKAIELAMEDRWGELVVYKGGEITVFLSKMLWETRGDRSLTSDGTDRS